jgi:hypothetical protein
MHPAQVKTITLEDILSYDKNNLLHYRIKYPQFYSYDFQNYLNVINGIYKRRAFALQRKTVNLYFQIAKDFYIFSVKRGIPIRLFEVSYIPVIAYNGNCTISLYYDEYAYTGGAHGTIFRTSDTWDIKKRRNIRLDDIVRCRYGGEYDYIKHLIIDRIKSYEGIEKFMCLENFEEKIVCNFYNENFYLVPEGLVVYYQQYDVAPYAVGIPQFLIPFNGNDISQPSCN